MPPPEFVKAIIRDDTAVHVQVYPVSASSGFLPYDYIESAMQVVVPLHRQMNIVEELTVMGELVVLGSVNLL